MMGLTIIVRHWKLVVNILIIILKWNALELYQLSSHPLVDGKMIDVTVPRDKSIVKTEEAKIQRY